MKKYRRYVLFFIAIGASALIKAASVDTVNIYSSAMHKQNKCVVVLPESYQKNNTHYPVVYLLHGYSGDYSDWIKKAAIIKSYADEFRLIIVCPDGHYNSWYVDSPVDSAIKYETFFSCGSAAIC